MTKRRRALAVVGLLGLAAIISSALHGQPGEKAKGAKTTTQIIPVSQVEVMGEATEVRFGAPGILTYQPLQGDAYFAMQLQPKLDPAPDRPRDILIMLSSAATQAGPSWIAGHQIAEAIIESARAFDRISLWTANEPRFTKNLTSGFLLAKDYAEGKRLHSALAQYRVKEYPSGDTDLKNALAEAVKAFDSAADRQRILLFLGDGLSTHNPMTEADRLAIARTMVDRKIAFFPVPLGIQMNPNTLHGLATSTGGVVLRTKVESEKLVDAMKRYEAAFAGPILYSPKVHLPAEMTDVLPTILPPLRADVPTLIVGRIKKQPAQVDYTITGSTAIKNGAQTVRATEKVPQPNLDNYFLVSMIDQWSQAKEYSAVLRADRALSLAYEQTRLQHLEYLENAHVALADNQLEAAGSLFQQARQLAPHDGQADAGIKIVDRLKDGTLTRDAIRKQLEGRVAKADQLKIVDGKPRWDKIDLVPLALKEENAPVVMPVENVLKEHRERQAVEEQRIISAVEETIRQSRARLASDPDGTLDLLRNLFNRVKDHPDLGGQVRDALGTRLQTALRESATDVQRRKQRKQEQAQASAQTQGTLTREQERKSFEERIDAQFRVYKNLMIVARVEEKAKADMLQAMVQIQEDARRLGQTVPIATKAIYDIALAAHPLQQHNTLIRHREEKWLSVLMQVEKSHVPYPDEPGIYFPPLATWKALIKARKGRYEVSGLPDDEKGREEADAVNRLLQQTIDTRGLQDKVKLKTALEFFSDKLGGNLPILVDRDAFAVELGADAPDPYEEEISLPPVPTKMQVSLALRLVLAQIGKGNATYLIRRNFVEITTNKRYLEDKVIRVYPVGDLVMPISNPRPIQGGFPGQFGGGIPGQFAGGGQFTGGSFQASFNGSLGALGATQAAGLIDIVTRIVDPGNWNRPPQLQPFMSGFPNPGMFGMVGFLGMNGNGMVGVGPPPDPNMNADPFTSNSIDFFPPALALIVRAPSRVHTSITGGIIGGRGKRLDAAAAIEKERNGLALVNNGKQPNIKVADAREIAKVEVKREGLDPNKVWNEAFTKGGIESGHVVAAADFLFKSGEFKHAAEFLKANLRHGIVARPWVFEALAVALEAAGGDPDEIRRARLSGIALDPADAQGFLIAARAMADRGQYDRAIAFCKQSALLEPNDFQPYQAALAFAENAKDSKAMEWAAGNLVRQDWPVDSLVIQQNAKLRLASLAAALRTEKRGAEASELDASLAEINRRDLIIHLAWENANGPAELELKVWEPSGSVCTHEQKQSPGGGILIGYNLADPKPSTQYVAAQALSGEYEITVTRIYGQPLRNRARLEIIQNAGTPQQTRRVEVVNLDQNATIKVDLKDGRRTELATVSTSAQQRRQPATVERERDTFNELRAIANPSYFGAKIVSDSALKVSSDKTPTTIGQNAFASSGNGVQMTTQIRRSADERGLDMVIRPFFQSVNAASNRPAINLSVVPGGVQK